MVNDTSAAIHGLSEEIVERALTCALLELRVKAATCQEEHRKIMNGKILVNGIDHLPEKIKLNEREQHGDGESKKNNLLGKHLISEKDKVSPIEQGSPDHKVTLKTIQEENNNESSDDVDDNDDEETLSSGSDSDSGDTSSDDESELEVEFTTPVDHKHANAVNKKPPDTELKTPLQNGEVSNGEPQKELRLGHSNKTDVLSVEDDMRTSNHILKSIDDNLTIKTGLVKHDSLVKSPLPMVRGLLNDHGKPSTSRSSDIAMATVHTNEHVEQSISGSSDVVMVTSENNDSVKPSTSGTLDVILSKSHQNRINVSEKETSIINNSGTSDDSDIKDKNDILAELQKIVSDKENSQDSSTMNTTSLLTKASTEPFSKASANSSVNLPSKGLIHSSTTEQLVGVIKSSQNSSDLSENSDLGAIPKSAISDSGSHGYSDTADSTHRANENGRINVSSDISGYLASGGSATVNGSHSDLLSYHDDNDKPLDGQLMDEKKEPIVHQTEATQSEEGTTSVHKKIQNKPNHVQFSDQADNVQSKDILLEDVEKKLHELEKSNSEQTSEIQRLKSVNDSLKIKFEKLEESSGHHHKIEDQMLKRNEELEKHLLGVLKAQEIIFDMKEKLKAAEEVNQKLSKDYQEAVKALEAVDKLFGQKDALVKKWKEATEESRRLVELLKKHNAEEADLENVDKLKNKIAGLKEKLLKAKQINERNEKKNEELAELSKTWTKKFEHENERAIKSEYELQEVKKELKNHQKLAAKRGRKSQLLQLEITELKDTLKLAKDKIIENERRLKEMEGKNSNTQEMYTNIIHEKEKQHSVLIKNSETYQKDLVANIQIAQELRKEVDGLKTTISGLESEKKEREEKLTKSEKNLEETLDKHTELSTEFAKLQSELEQSKITAVDNELYTEEQTVRLKELEEQCRDLQAVLQQFIYSNTKRHKRHTSHGKKLRPSHSMPTHPNLDMYRKLLAPPRSMRTRRRRVGKSEGKRQSGPSDEDNTEGDDMARDVRESFVTSTPHSSLHQQRPKSTYGNRSLSARNEASYQETEHNSRDWIPKIVLVDSQKLEAGSDNDSGSVSADQYAMQYVKLGDKVLIELPVEGKKQNLPGVVKYVGPVYHRNFRTGIYAGLKLDIPVGDTNGTVGGRIYFRCLKKHGKFIKLSHILAVQNPRTQQYTRILPMSYS